MRSRLPMWAAMGTAAPRFVKYNKRGIVTAPYRDSAPPLERVEKELKHLADLNRYSLDRLEKIERRLDDFRPQEAAPVDRFQRLAWVSVVVAGLVLMTLIGALTYAKINGPRERQPHERCIELCIPNGVDRIEDYNCYCKDNE